VPAAALAPDVTRHDVNWGAEGARRHSYVAVSGDGSALTLTSNLLGFAWAQGPVGATSGKHWFSVSVTQSNNCFLRVGWVDRALSFADTSREYGPGNGDTSAAGGVFATKSPCTVGCLLDVDGGAMTVYLDGERVEQQRTDKFPQDGRAWYPSVGLGHANDVLFSNTAA
jgi:hypothetical protein